MIKKLTNSDDQSYLRPNDATYSIPAVSTDDQNSKVLVQRRSLRSLRKQFTWAVTAFTVGSLLILFQSPGRNDFLAPGPLTSNHAQILNGLGADRCNACHKVGNQSFMQWAVGSLQVGRNIQMCQSELCMKCHQETMDSTLATKPHNVQPSLLATMNNPQFVSTGSSESIIESAGDNIECSSCHKEHHGNRELALLTDQQCQTCHQQQFDSFENGHPEFANWPQSQRQGIAFDHVSHGFKHFASSNKQFDCKLCHVDDSYSNIKGLASYEQSCAQCHDKDIEIRSEPGLQIVGLPMLDLDAIGEQGLSVGSWPENATGDFDGEIPELMQLLLSCDEEFLGIAQRRSGAMAFSDFDPGSEIDVQDAVNIIWSIKRLVYDLAVGGSDVLAKKYAYAMGLSEDDNRVYLLTRGLDANVFAEAANRWFPGLAQEIPLQHQDPGAAITAVNNDKPEPLNEGAPSSLASLIGNEPVLYFVPSLPIQDQDVLVENPLKDLMSGKSKTPPPESSEVATSSTAAAVATANSLEAPQQARGTPANPGTGQTGMQIAAQAQIPEQDLLATNPLQGKSLTGQTPAANSLANNAVQTPSADEQVHRTPFDSDDQSEVAKEFAHGLEQAQLKKTPDEQRLGGGFEIVDRYGNGEVFVGTSQGSGWFRNDELFQISYRPVKHADNFLTTMMELVANVPDAENSPVSQAYFKKMVSKSSVGACNDCHTIDAELSRFRVNWQASYRDPAIRAFTHFSHGPHLIQQELSDCTACHQLNSELTNAHTFVQFDSSQVISNFDPIRKSNCVSCHHETGAGNSCTQCHDYHVGARVLMGE